MLSLSEPPLAVHQFGINLRYRIGPFFLQIDPVYICWGLGVRARMGHFRSFTSKLVTFYRHFSTLRGPWAET